MKLHIKRQSAYVGAAMKHRIIIDGIEYAKLGNGKDIILDVPDRDFTLKVSMVGNSMNPHKIEACTIVRAQDCKSGIIQCSIRPENDWKGILTGGLFAPMAVLHLDISY